MLIILVLNLAIAPLLHFIDFPNEHFAHVSHGLNYFKILGAVTTVLWGFFLIGVVLGNYLNDKNKIYDLKIYLKNIIEFSENHQRLSTF